MKLLLSSLLFFMLLDSATAQCDSTLFRYAGTYLYDVSLIDSNRIIAVGDNGYIVKSNDGGKSWKSCKTYTPNFLKTVQMVSDSVGYAAGNSKTILKTEDGGENWFPLFTTITTTFANDGTGFNDLYFFNKDRGIIVGEAGLIISTNDGGKSWTSAALSFSTERLSGITFTSDSIGFICGSSAGLYKTTNGGRTWQKTTISGLSSSQIFNKIRFMDNLTGFMVGNNGVCLKTTDGGTTWASIYTPYNGSGVYQDILFVSATKGFIIGNYTGGFILQTVNGGSAWTVAPYYPNSPYSVYGISTDPLKKKLVLVGGGGGNDGSGVNGRTIITSGDGGTTLTPVSNNGEVQYNDVYFLNDSTGYLTGGSGIALKTTDYGESWQPLQRVPVYNGGNMANKIMFLDTLNGFAASDLISKTTDGGKTWNKTVSVPGGFLQFFATQIHFFDPLKGLVQDASSLYKTTDGGTSWTNVNSATNFSYRDFAVTGSGKVFAVGSGGKMNVSTDEGNSWTAFNLNTTKNLLSIYFYNSQVGYIGTDDTTIFKTTDGGNTWAAINTGVTIGWGIRSFRFMNDSVGYMQCYNSSSASSLLCKTISGGRSWYRLRQDPGGFSRLAGFKTLYYTGKYGLIVKSESLQKPAQAGYLYGPDKGCADDRVSYISGPMTGLNYNWTLSGGGSQTINANKDTISWSTPGTYTLSYTASNVCGTSPVRQLTIEVIRFQPTITVQDSVLTATEGSSYQWYQYGQALGPNGGGTSRSIIGRVNGSYTVQVKSYYGCTVTSPAVDYAGYPAQLCPGGNATLFCSATSSYYQWQRDTGTGFVAVPNSGYYAGASTKTLQLNGIPSSWAGYKFRCANYSGYSEVYVLQFVNRWNGTADNRWENPANWSCGTVPDANTDVVITSGTLTISSNVTIRKLSLSPSASLTVQAGNTLTITN